MFLATGAIYCNTLFLLAWNLAVICDGETTCGFSATLVKSGHQQKEVEVDDPNIPHGNNGGHGKILPDNQTIVCEAGSSFCFSYWQSGPNNTDISWIKRGCWDHPDSVNSCKSNGCVNNMPWTKNNSKFCCCYGYKCNDNVQDIYNPSDFTTEKPWSTPTLQFMSDPNYRKRTIILALSLVCGATLLVIIAYVSYRLWLSSRKSSSSDCDSMADAENPPSPTYELNQLKMDILVQKGRYGEIWQGELFDNKVAVKVFNTSQRQYYLNERNIYTLPFIEHDSILKFYGAEERLTDSGATQYVVVLSYLPYGSLMSYLKNNTVSWLTCQRMCHSIANGLAHLHMDISKGDKFKPVVAHRDLNSRNIVVKPDLSCAIIDFGFAMCISGCRLIRNGQEENAEHTSLIDVGTLRYMAPEVLDGAVNLRDCEASLKQIDVYALGLVMWEVCSRCSDLYQGETVTEYQPPFQLELGCHPTLEEMQLLVSRNKRRPDYPAAWKDSNEAIRLLKETIDDCWDQDGEARLTALCVEERLAEISSLWSVRYRDTTPTVHSHGNIGFPDTSIMYHNLVPTYQRYRDDVKNTNVASSSSSDLPLTGYRRLDSGGERSVSESTAETTLSPSEPMDYRNVNITTSLTLPAKRSLQSYKGQNPAMALNTHKRSDEELTIEGNELLTEGAAPRQGDLQSLHDQLFDTVNDDSSLLGQQQPQPIPYLQNYVSSARPQPAPPAVVRPKQFNHPVSGRLNTKVNNDACRQPKTGGFKFPFLSKTPFFKGLVDKTISKKSVSIATQHDENLANVRIINEAKSNLYNQHQIGQMQAGQTPLQTQVCLMNGSPVVRPAHLQLTKTNAPAAAAAATTNSRLAVAQVGVAKLQQNTQNTCNGHVPALIKQRNAGNVVHDARHQPGTSSSLNGDFVNGKVHNNNNNNVDKMMGDVKHRVKTPCHVIGGRYSLYDDRIMSVTNESEYPSANNLCKSSISLHHFDGLINIDMEHRADDFQV